VSGKPDTIALTATPAANVSFTPASVAPGADSTMRVTTKAGDSGTVVITIKGVNSFTGHAFDVTLTIGSGGTTTSYEAEAPGNTLFGGAKRRTCAICSGMGEVGGILGHGKPDA
jgi:hypothetical protein